MLRSGSASAPALAGMRQLVMELEAHYPEPRFLALLYRWRIGAAILIGFRQGTSEYGPLTHLAETHVPES